MAMTATLLHRLAGFARDTRGSVSVEFILVMPFLFWAFMASYVYFDGYRQSNTNLKAAYTIGDLISRETAAIDQNYVDSMYRLLQLMTRSGSEVKLRITVIRYDEDDDRYHVDWSAARGFSLLRTNANLRDIEDRLPTMPDSERVILIETSNTFVPLFDVGIGTIPLDNFVFTRPRFAPQVAWAGA